MPSRQPQATIFSGVTRKKERLKYQLKRTIRKRSNMDILQSSYFKYNKCLYLFGLWPYQDIKMRYAVRIPNVLLFMSLLIPSLCKMFELRHNVGYVLLGIPSFLFYLELATKYVYSALKNNQMKCIFDHIKKDFQLKESKKIETLRNYAEDAEYINKFYAIYVSTVVLMYSLSAWTPHVLDILVPLNQSRPKPIPRFMRYYINSIDDNFNFIFLHGLIVDCFTILLFIGFDSFLVNCSQHGCALLKIVINDLEDCLNVSKNIDADNKEALKLHQDKFYNEIVKAIDMHRYALEFIAMVDSMFTEAIFFIIGITMLTISLTEFATVVYLNDTGLMIRFLFATVGEFVHIVYFNWPGQKIQDHSLLVYQSCYECEWYREDISVRCKKLLKLMMVRSQVASHLTAGMYVLSYEYFARIIKASLSFFTVLLSVH